MIAFGVIAAIVFLCSILTSVICELMIINRLRDLNNGVQSPLVSVNGVDVNIYNGRFARFLFSIQEENDVLLKKFKIINIIAIVFLLCSFLIVVIITGALD